MIVNYTKERIANVLNGTTVEVPSYFMIGSGSGTALATQTTLITPTDRQLMTSRSGTSTYKVMWQGDWNNTEMSGLSLREFGLTISGTGTTGSMWSRTTLPTITFDGSMELQIQEQWEVF